MFVRLKEKKMNNGNLVIQSKITSLLKDQPSKKVEGLNKEAKVAAKSNCTRLSKQSISTINSTLNRLFNQGLLKKFHYKEIESVLIITKNLSEEIQQCINYEKYAYDIRVIHIEEMSQVDSNTDIIFAFDFVYETIFFNEISEQARGKNVPFIQFEIADKSLYMGPVYFNARASVIV